MRTWLIPGVVLAGVLAALACWHFDRSAPADLPSFDLSRMDDDATRAIRIWEDLARRNPGSGTALGRLGALLRVYGLETEALDCLARAARLEPANPRWPHFQSLILTARDPAAAIALARQAADLCGTEPPNVRWRLGKLLAEQGDWDAATAAWEPLIAAKPGFAPARLAMAQAAVARGHLAEAEEWARGCLEDPGTRKAAWTLMAGLHRRRAEVDEATSASERARSLPADAPLPDPFEVEITALRADPRGLTTRAHTMLAEGDLEAATELVNRLVAAHSEDPETWLLLGRLRYLRRDFTGAEDAFRRLLDMDPRSTQGLFQMGMAMLGQDRFAEAAETFHQATLLKPDFGPAHFNRAYALGRGGQWHDAVAPFLECIRHNPEHLRAYVLLADVYLQLGERDKAAEVLERADRVRPGDSSVGALRARAGL